MTITLVGNFAVAGTEKFMSHALKVAEPHWITYCGLHLQYHKTQQWEEVDADILQGEIEIKPACKKCWSAIEKERRQS
jgi:hypothetical protein